MTKTYCRDSSILENVVVGFGSCIALDRITVDGALVWLNVSRRDAERSGQRLAVRLRPDCLLLI